MFFKESKQLLGLGKDQSTDFDAQLAHTTLVLIQHIFLSLKNQVEQYQTLGKLFEGTRAETLEYRLHERLIALLLELVQLMDELIAGVDVEEIVDKAIQNPETFERLKAMLNPPSLNQKVAA